MLSAQFALKALRDDVETKKFKAQDQDQTYQTAADLKGTYIFQRRS